MCQLDAVSFSSLFLTMQLLVGESLSELELKHYLPSPSPIQMNPESLCTFSLLSSLINLGSFSSSLN